MVSSETELGKNRKNSRLAGVRFSIGLICCLLMGCAYPSALERDYGRSVRNNTAQQVINPLAGLDPTPAVGLDPKAGQYSLERYDKSFKEKEVIPPVIQLSK